LTVSLVRDSPGAIVNFIAVREESKDRRAPEQAHRYLALILDSSDDAIFGRMIKKFIRPAAQTWCAFSRNQIRCAEGVLITQPVT
jgi:hypothetical protein